MHTVCVGWLQPKVLFLMYYPQDNQGMAAKAKAILCKKFHHIMRALYSRQSHHEDVLLEVVFIYRIS